MSSEQAVDFSPTAPPADPAIYDVEASKLTVHQIQNGLRYSSSLFQAISDELITRLQSSGLWKQNLRGQDERCNAMVTEAIENLHLQNFTEKPNSAFFEKALRTRMRQLNENAVNSMRRQTGQVKRDVAAPFELSPSKARKISEDKAVPIDTDLLLPPTALPTIPLNPATLQLMIQPNDSEKVCLISIQRILNDQTVTERLWTVMSLEKLYIVLRQKGFWSDEDERTTAGSQLYFQTGGRRKTPINDDDDLQEACKLAESFSMGIWVLSIERGPTASIESSVPSSKAMQSMLALAARPRLTSKNTPPASPRGSITKGSNTDHMEIDSPTEPSPEAGHDPIPASNPEQSSSGKNEESGRMIDDPSPKSKPFNPSDLRESPRRDKSPIDIYSDSEVEIVEMQTYASADAQPPYQPLKRQTGAGLAMPPPLRIQESHKDRKPDSYDINIGEITRERRDPTNVDELDEDESMNVEHMLLGAEERPQWNDGKWREMENVFQLRPNDRSTRNRRTLRGLGMILDQKGNRVPVEPYVHQLYDVIWRRMMASQCGGAINADEPGFGKTLMVIVSWILNRQIALRHAALDGYFTIKTMKQFNDSHFRGKHLLPRRLRSGKALHDKCPSAHLLDIACPCECDLVRRLVPKVGLAVVYVPAKIMGTWLAELTKLVDFEDRKVMQLRVFYVQHQTYWDVSAEMVSDDNIHLLRCNQDGSTPDGQERFLVVIAAQSYDRRFKQMLKSEWNHNFTLGQIFVNEFHETKSDTATIPTQIETYKNDIIASIQSQDPRLDDETEEEWHERLKDAYRSELPHVYGFSATPWMKSFNDLAAMVKLIEQPWWSSDPTWKSMTGAECRETGAHTERMEARTTPVAKEERKKNVARMKALLDHLMIKRTASSRTIDGKGPLVILPPHQTRKVLCHLSAEHRKLLQDADKTITKQAQREYESLCRQAEERGKPIPKASLKSYFSKAVKLRAPTVIPNLLPFAEKYGLKLTDDELRNAKGCNRPVFSELEGKEEDWLKCPEDSLYQLHLDQLTKDAPKLLALKNIIDQLGEDIYGRPEKLVIFTSSPVVSMIVGLWLKKTYPSEQTLWCSSACALKDRSSLFVQPFEEDDVSRFLISTKRILGTGVTLTRAFRSVNLDADWIEHRRMAG